MMQKKKLQIPETFTAHMKDALGQGIDVILAASRTPMQASIREDECIGCTKCITACPVDAIVGTAKHMHSILVDECIGCNLCVEPCPVDCIDMLRIPEAQYNAEKARFRHAQIQLRHIAKKKKKKKEIKQLSFSKATDSKNAEIDKRKEYIQAAIARSKAKKTKK